MPTKYNDEIKNQLKKRTDEAKRNSYLAEKNIDIKTPIVISDLFPDTLFEDSHRLIPNDFARSCLFTAKHPKVQRKTCTRERLFHISANLEILFTGQELRSLDDELIWLQLVYYCRNSPLGNLVEFKIRDLIEDIGWQPSGHYYQKVRESLSRMKATEIFIKNDSAYGTSAGMSLIESYIGLDNSDTDKQPTRYQIKLDKNLIILFAGNTFTNLPWAQYKKLSPMARRLADYAFSHKYPNPLLVTNFLKLCGSERINSPVKTQNLASRRVCDELVQKNLVKDAYVQQGKIIIFRK